MIIDIIIKVIMEFLDLGNYMCFILNSIFSEIIMVYVSEYYKIENYWIYFYFLSILLYWYIYML